MNKDVRAEILNLSASILLGKATEADIKKVVKLAIDNKETEYLESEFKDCGKILALCPKT